MLATAWFATVRLMRSTSRHGSMSVREAVSSAARMFAQSLPLAVVLFVLFPRLPGQFWSVVPGSASAATTGLGDEM